MKLLHGKLETILCFVAALLFIISNVLGIVHYITLYKKNTGSNFKEFNTEEIQEYWITRYEYRTIEWMKGICNVLAWITFTIPIIHFIIINEKYRNNNNNNKISNNNNTLLVHIIIIILAITGSMTECISHLLSMGITTILGWITYTNEDDFNLSHWITSNNNFDNIGWKTIELIHIVLHGMLLWIDAFEWLLMFFIMILFFITTKSSNTTNNSSNNNNENSSSTMNLIVPNRWRWISMYIGLLSIIDFIAQVATFHSGTIISKLAIFISIVNRIILLPIWLFYFGFYFLYIHKQQHQSKNNTSLSNKNNNSKKKSTTMSVIYEGDYDDDDDDEMVLFTSMDSLFS